MPVPETVVLIRADSGPSAVALTLDGTVVHRRWGRAGVLDRMSQRDLHAPEAAQRAFDDAVFRLINKGYRAGAEHPGLLAAIEAAPHEPDGYLVYRDWLVTQGDPRAGLIGATLEPTWRKAIRERLEAHRWHFLRRDWHLVGQVWWRGFLHTVRYPPYTGYLHASRGAQPEGDRLRVTSEWARRFLLGIHRHPSGRFLQVIEEPARDEGGRRWLQRWRVSFDLSVEPWAIHLQDAATVPMPIHAATLDALCTLPQVGPRLARRIVRARTRSGIRSLADLAAVPGLGEKTAAALAPRLQF